MAVEISPPTTEVTCETPDLTVEISPTTPEETFETRLDAKPDTRLSTDETAVAIGLLEAASPPVTVTPGNVTVSAGSPTETPMLIPEDL